MRFLPPSLAILPLLLEACLPKLGPDGDADSEGGTDSEGDTWTDSWGDSAPDSQGDSWPDSAPDTGGGETPGPRGTIDLGTAPAALWGETNGEFAGIAVAAAGDADGDGIGDVLVGATAKSGWAGGAYLARGPFGGGQSLADAAGVWAGYAGDGAGNAVAGAGDTNGDGLDDLLVGASGSSHSGTAAGAAYLLAGPAAGTFDLLSGAQGALCGEVFGDAAGTALASTPDVDGDLWDDLAIGAPRNSGGALYAGAVYLASGSFSGWVGLGSAWAKVTGWEADGRAGSAVAVVDLDGTGLPVLVVGAPQVDGGDTDDGAVYLVADPPAGTTSLFDATAILRAGSAGEKAGSSLAAAGDGDGDGYGEALVGAPWADRGMAQSAGRAYLVDAAIAGEGELGAARATLLGCAANDYAGISVAGAGDVDADGRADILIGAYLEDSAGNEAGATYLLYGPVAGVVDLAAADATLLGAAAGDRAGWAVAGAGDTDADGYADLLVGGPYAEGGDGTSNGVVWVIPGGP